MIEFVEINKSFREDFWRAPKKVLNNLSFKVEEGSLCGFLGANGAGKTTSIKTLFQFIKQDSGQINFSPRLGDNWKKIKSQLGYFPERPYFYPSMTGREFCLYLGSLQGMSGKKLNDAITYWTKRLSIEFALDKKIRSYSKGMLQRLGFSCALIHSPRFIVLDEPLSGLDPLGRKEFKDILVELNKEGITIFFSSHIVSDVEEICDWLVVIKDGSHSFCGSTQELLGRDVSKDVRLSFYDTKNITSELANFGFNEINRTADLVRGSVNYSVKNDVVKMLVESNIEIDELTTHKISLEEIIYQLKSRPN